jgi:hypothetical protein
MNKGLFQSQAESHFGALIHGSVRKNPPIRRAWYFGALVSFRATSPWSMTPSVSTRWRQICQASPMVMPSASASRGWSTADQIARRGLPERSLALEG